MGVGRDGKRGGPVSENSKSFKRRVRERMAETGEKYTTAMRAIQAEFDQANSPDEVQENLIPVWLGLPDPGGDASTFDLSEDMLRAVLQAGISLEVVSLSETLHQVPDWMREIPVEMGMEDAVMVYDRHPKKVFGALRSGATFNVVARPEWWFTPLLFRVSIAKRDSRKRARPRAIPSVPSIRSVGEFWHRRELARALLEELVLCLNYRLDHHALLTRAE